MLRGLLPAQGLQVGQRWLREDPADSSKLILEISNTDKYAKYTVYAIVVHSLQGKGPVKSNDHWTSNLHDSPCYYTYLEGQDKPS